MTNGKLIELNPEELSESSIIMLASGIIRKELASAVKLLLGTIVVGGVLWLIFISMRSRYNQAELIADCAVIVLPFFGSLYGIISAIRKRCRLISGKYPNEQLILIGVKQKEAAKKLAKMTQEKDREKFLHTEVY